MMTRAMFRSILLSVSLAVGAYSANVNAAQTLDQLLTETREARQREAKINQEREAQFLSERNKRAAMLAQAREELTKQKARTAELSAAYDRNEKQLTALQEELDGRAGNLGEMFGVVRQVANDFSSVVRNSMISAQYPDREEFIAKLAQSKSLPSIEELERFWFELQREMTESGSVARFKTTVVTPSGAAAEASVTRVGPFTAVSDGQYLA